MTQGKTEKPAEEFMGVPIEGAMERVLSRQSAQAQQQTQIPAVNKEGFIYVPSLNLYVAKQRDHLGINWPDTHSALVSENLRMPTIPEFIAYLRYLNENKSNPEFLQIYNEITEKRDPWRANWLDADFKVINGILHINYNHILQNGKLIPKNSDSLDRDTLMQNKTPGVSLEELLRNPTSQGLPRQGIIDGELYYWAPMSDNKSVAGFGAGSGGAYLSCNRYPSDGDSSLGVFAVADAGQNARP